SAMAAVNEGRVSRILLKPCPPPVLLAALTGAAAQYRLGCAQRVLLEQTRRPRQADARADLEALFALARDLFGCSHAALGWRGRFAAAPMQVLAEGIDTALLDSAGPPTALAVLREPGQYVQLRAEPPSVLADLPAGHPPVCELLGVPIATLSACYGWLYFADTRRARRFDASDVEAASALASAAALICEADRRRSQVEPGETPDAELIDSLRRAVSAMKFELLYQPQVDLRTGAIVGAEALLRWNSPELGAVSPALFVPALEISGLIVDVGCWVVEQVGDDRRRWLDEGLAPPPISINVSPLQLRSNELVDAVKHAARRDPTAASDLVLEIGASVLLGDDADDRIARLGALHALGVSIAVDHIGAASSALSRLGELPVTTVKLDRAFVHRLCDSPDTVAMTSAMVTLAHALNLGVVAEGVETTEQLRLLRLLDCDRLQGFLFSPAVTAAELAVMLQQGRRLEVAP
ncbi:MAG: EAL domain-containing protein, partial [Gammaproteobacteria bacterium]